MDDDERHEVRFTDDTVWQRLWHVNVMSRH